MPDGGAHPAHGASANGSSIVICARRPSIPPTVVVVVEGPVVVGDPVVVVVTSVVVVGPTVVEVGAPVVVVEPRVVEVTGTVVVLLLVVEELVVVEEVLVVVEPHGAGHWSCTACPTAFFKQSSASLAVMVLGGFGSQTHGGVQVSDPTAARKMKRQSEAVGVAPLVTG